MTIDPEGPAGAERDGGSSAGDLEVVLGPARTLIETSTSIDSGRRRAAEQAAGARLSQKALQGSSLAELLDDATFTLADTLGVDQSTVFLFDEDDADKLVLAAAWGPLAARVGRLRVLILGSVSGLALARREPVTCLSSRDRARFPASVPLFDQGIESSIFVAIEGPDHAVGVLGAHCGGHRAFNRDDELFVQTVANVVGAAILRDGAEVALMEAEEGERRRIAEAVHDDTLQVMIAVALRLETLEREADDDEQKEKIRRLVVDTRGAASRLRSLAFDLFPEDLGSGLEAVLERLLAETAAECGFTFTLAVDLARPPPKVVARTLYRNVREAIVNIRKHAGARHVTVALWSEGDGTAVRVTDDGIGIPPRAAVSGTRGHLGIKGLRERTTRTGGRISIEPGEEGGTTVAFWLPGSVRRPGGPAS